MWVVGVHIQIAMYVYEPCGQVMPRHQVLVVGQHDAVVLLEDLAHGLLVKINLRWG